MFQNSTLPSVSADITRNIAGSLPRMGGWRGLAQLEKSIPLPRTFQEYLVWALAMATVIGLALLQVAVTLQISQAQQEVYLLQRQYDQIEQENAELLWEISHYTTLERVEREAAAAGFVPALKRRYVEAQTAAPAPAAFSQPEQAIENPTQTGWAVEVDEQSRPFAADFSQHWEGWTAQLREMGTSWGEGVARLTDDIRQKWLMLDFSSLQWMRNLTE